jgi:CRP-like cAMP-binding protein
MDPASLKRLPLFADLTDDDLAAVSSWATEKSVPEGAVLVREGDYSYDFFVIIEGGAEVTRGGEHLADLGTGDLFGEVGVLTSEQRNATVTATSSSRLLILSHWDLDKLRKRIPALDERMHAQMEQHLTS